MATEGKVKRLGAWLSAPVSPLPLVWFRVGFGLLMFAGAVRFVSKGWVRMQYLEPAFHFHYLFFDWVRPLPGNWLYAVFAVQMVAALLIAAGRLYRPAAVAFFLSFTYVELLDKATYLNHYYFVSLVAFLLVFLPLERWGALGGGGVSARALPRSLAPRWVLLVLRAQIAIVYFFAGVAKLNPDWLLSAQPLGIWLSSRSGVALLGNFADEPWLAFAMSWGGAAFDLSVPFFLSFRKTRPWAYLAVVGFHAATAALFPIGMFPWIMIVATTVFFSGEELAVARPLFATASAPRGPITPSPSPIARGVILVFFLLQLLIPLRHLAYPGNVLWSEEGYRFSWRVMLVEKSGSVVYRLTDPESGRSWDVFPSEILTPLQERQMAFQPDMILDLAHHLRDERVAAGHLPPEVRADVFVSLNGRAAARLVDPEVDLAVATRGLAPKRWIELRRGGLP